MLNIKSTIEKVPAGMVVIPLFLAMAINTVAPGLLRIGGFTEALFVDGTLPLIALFLVCVGAQFRVDQLGGAVKKGLTLLLLKWGVASVIAFVAYIVVGPGGLFLGIMAPIAILAAMSNSAGAVYLAIADDYGEEEDLSLYPFLAMNDGPFLSMVALTIFGAMGYGQGLFSFTDFLSVLVPMIVGGVLGNLDASIRELLYKGIDLIIPFFAFAIGMNINLGAIIEGGLGGIVIGLMTVFITGGAAYIFYSLAGWNPIVGAGEGTTSGNAIATPAALAAANPAFESIVDVATVQIAAAVVTGLIFLPLFIIFLAKRLEKKGKLYKQGELVSSSGSESVSQQE